MIDTVRTQKIFFAMGTVNTVTLFEESDEALSAAKERVKGLDRKLSAYSHDSEIYAINSRAGISPVAVSMDTFRLIKHSVMYSRLTDGLFDITSRPLSQLWKNAVKCGQLPDDSILDEARKLVDYRDIILDYQKRTVMLKNKGQQIDLGAIAKGYAADEVRNILHAYGIENAVINFGGTVINMGQQRNIGIQKPFAPNGQSAASIKIGNEKAVVSSGLYEQFCIIDDSFIHHITDIRTGKPSDSGLLGVSLVGDNAEELDALATAAFIMGAAKSMELLKHRNIEALFITDDKKVYVTENLREKIRM
ncbi:FAD:protein FMN transferase [Ruminococcus flavefaciens]|uniref:FAD:protein FMN transferase n=1 Tax=Ruminococcus flavefaciens TaxID=1265 RepID=UPI0026EE0C29|nr:FAD:protein FMN transferase [Ruminococcus flavefaciens]